MLSDPQIGELLHEPFRNIKNKLEYKSYKHNQKTILITSTVSGEGKSFFSVNLALSLAASGRKVVLIDCDLRNPTGRLVFNMPKGVGLCEYLIEENSLVEYLMSAKKENNHSYPNLFFLPGGTPVDDGSHLLSSHRMQELIDYTKENSDYVILDSAPVGILTDSAVLAKCADGAIMVIRKGLARVDLINDALVHLSESEIPIVGGILNDA